MKRNVLLIVLSLLFGETANALLAPQKLRWQRKAPSFTSYDHVPSSVLTTKLRASNKFAVSNQILTPSKVISSPLFQRSNPQAKHLVPRRLQKVVAAAMPFLLMPLLIPTQAAMAASPLSSAQQSIASFRAVVPWKRVFKAGLVAWSVSSLISNYRVKKRQAILATSEWRRYALYPAARGRAIMWLMMQQIALLLASKVVRFRRSALRQYAGTQFADSLLKLGPLYIKLGQIVSCRKNLLGPEWIDAMATLQDKVPAQTGQDALDLAYSTLKGGKEEFEEIFSDFDATPLAAASLGQVHKATLRKGNVKVAVKLQRPFLKKIYDQDLELLTTIAKWMDKIPSAQKNVGGVASSWTKIFQDAEEILYREIDYRDEGNNAMQFANDFGLTLGGNAITPTAKARNNEALPSAADWIRTPYVFQNVSNERLLVMEYVPSIKITDTEKLQAANVTDADRIDLADALARAYLRQFCNNLFFSTDPHPGNLGVEILPDGKPRLVFYDFGQAATLTQGQADGILKILEAIIDMDVERSVEAFIQMGVLVDGADLDVVRAKVADNYRTGKVKANRKQLRRKGYKFKAAEEETKASETDESTANGIASGSNATATDGEVMSFFTLPAEYAFVARAISQLDGVGKGLDPDFDFISNAAPFIVEIKGADVYLKDEFQKFYKGAMKGLNHLRSKER